MANEYDLKIAGGDLAFGPDGEPVFVAGVEAVAQDVRHRLVASGLAAELVGDDADPAGVLGRIAFEVEEDRRIRPGTARAEKAGAGAVRVTARTLSRAAIALTVVS